jgi:Icc-related predicted phosphoesterase
MTELYINGQLIEDIDAEIAMTLSSFKLDSLGTRKGSYSNVFDLPKTNQTRLLFENCELVTSVTNIPYQLNPCQIFINGQLVVDGSAVIRETKENYKVFISAGNSDFFKAIGSLKIKDVSLSDFNHDYTLTNVRDRRVTTNGFVYPNIDYGFFEFADLTTWNTGTILNRQQYFQPSMWIRTIIERAAEDLGYTITGDLIDSLTYQNGVVLCKGAVVKTSNSLAKYRHNIDFGQLSGTTQKINFPERIEDKSNLYANNVNAGQFVYSPNVASIADTAFVINLTGKVITKDPRNQTNGEVNIDLIIYNAAGTVLLTITDFVKFENRFTGLFNRYNPPTSGQLDRTFNSVYPVGATDRDAFRNLLNNTADLTTLRFGWNVRVDRGNLASLQFENLEFSINQIPLAGRFIQGQIATVEAQDVLPQNETVGDLLITLGNIEGLIFQVDESNKTVLTSRIDRLINSKGNALDWSDKIDLTDEAEVFYNIENFAQSNLYKFANDDKDAFLIEGETDGSINIQNANLPTERVVFESKFATVPQGQVFNGEITMGRVFTGSKYTFDGFTYTLIEPFKIEEFKPRIAVLTEIDSVLDVSVGLTTPTNFTVNALVLDFERAVNDNYNLIRSVLNNTKVVKALFLLGLKDIVNLDFTRPVFIDYFGEFFYIESIDQFKVNKRESCFVKLVRI